VIITAFADIPMTVRAMTLGAVTVLEKPYHHQDLRDAIGKALVLSGDRRRDEAHVLQKRACLASLTAEESQVLDLILAGSTNKGIARKLQIGLRTVEARRHSIMAKFGVHSLAELVRIAWETRILAGQPGTPARDLALLRGGPHLPVRRY
jgi:FixJ family two-component response regulator